MIVAQEVLDALSDLYGAWYWQPGKTQLQFDCMEQVAKLFDRARACGLTIKCTDFRNPDPPKPDLPLFNAFD